MAAGAVISTTEMEVMATMPMESESTSDKCTQIGRRRVYQQL